MGDTSQQHPPLVDATTTRQDSVEPTPTSTPTSSTSTATTTATTATSMTQGTTATPSRQPRKDALLPHKHGRSSSHGRVAPPSNNTTTTTTTSSGHSNNNNRRHSHTVTNSKTRPMMRSVSNQPHQQHSSSTTASTTATATTTSKSERRARTSTEQRTRRKPKFVCGDHADEVDPSSDQQQEHHQQVTHSHGAAMARAIGEGEREGKEEGVLEAGRALEHDGHHPYPPHRHKHDPYPVSPSGNHILRHQAHHPQSTEVARRGVGRGKESQAVSSQQGNLDLGRGPNSESIPNHSQRPHPLPRPSSTSPPSKGKEATRKQPEIAAIRLTAPDDMVPTPTPNTITVTAAAAETSSLQPTTANANTNTTKTIWTSASSSTATSSSSSEESDVAAIRAKMTNLALVGKEHEQEQKKQGQQESDNTIPKDTVIVGGEVKGGSEEISRHNRVAPTTTTTTMAMGQPKIPELAVHNSSTTTTPAVMPGTSIATAESHSPTSQQQPTARVSAAAAIAQPSQKLSARLTRLLNPSLSTTSFPALSKTTSEPVVTIVSPNHRHSDTLVGHANAPSSNLPRKDSSPLQKQGPQRAETEPSISSSAVDLVSKLLNPVVGTIGRSRSQSSLHTMFANALAGPPLSSSPTATSPLQHRRQHSRHGSGASLAGSVKSNPGSSMNGNGAGFTTSPPRVSDTNVYFISRFITPATQAALSSSAPKQKVGPLSSSSGGSMAARRRLPASLRMSSSDTDAASGGGGGGGGGGGRGAGSISATASTAIGATPTSPGAGSTYSSAEGPTPPPPTSTSSFLSPNSPWNPIEAMSRTQQKLLLQRDSFYEDLDEQELSRRDKMHKEMERIQREYKCIRMTSDPVMDSMARCFALQREGLDQQCQRGGGSSRVGGREGHGDQSRHLSL